LVLKTVGSGSLGAKSLIDKRENVEPSQRTQSFYIALLFLSQRLQIFLLYPQTAIELPLLGLGFSEPSWS
jgi:hypothetical protein